MAKKSEDQTNTPTTTVVLAERDQLALAAAVEQYGAEVVAQWTDNGYDAMQVDFLEKAVVALKSGQQNFIGNLVKMGNLLTEIAYAAPHGQLAYLLRRAGVSEDVALMARHVYSAVTAHPVLMEWGQRGLMSPTAIGQVARSKAFKENPEEIIADLASAVATGKPMTIKDTRAILDQKYPMALPTLEDLYNPILQAITWLGGSASSAELNREVLKELNLTDEELAETTSTGASKVVNRIAWSKINLRGCGLLATSESGLWVLTEKGKEAGTVNPREISREYQRVYAAQRKARQQQSAGNAEVPPLTDTAAAETLLEQQLAQTWQEQLRTTLYNIAPAAFERLCQRLLRESGFTQVRVTGKSGDGGIDGVGIVQIGGLLSFPVVFQCKRYQGTVGPGEIREFRGAMSGRAERGLVITTGTFTPSARQEATRDGVPLIDLLDGEQLIEKLKERRLGMAVKTIEVEEVTVLPDWFKDI